MTSKCEKLRMGRQYYIAVMVGRKRGLLDADLNGCLFHAGINRSCANEIFSSKRKPANAFGFSDQSTLKIVVDNRFR